MASNRYIVLEDEMGEYWPGALIDELDNNKLVAPPRNLSTIPVVPDLFRKSGVGGFHQRHWGSGWRLNTAIPKLFCPLTLFLVPELQTLNWAAKLILDPAFKARIDAPVEELEEAENLRALVKLQGFIIPARDSSQVNPKFVGIGAPTQLKMENLSTLDLNTGLIVGGKATITVPGEGHYGLALYGHAPGLLCVWAAMSQTRLF